MKCEKCGKNEATYFYSSNINGKVTEKHLCQDCAAEENMDIFPDFEKQLSRAFENSMQSMFAPMGFFQPMFSPGFGGGFFTPTRLMPMINILVDGTKAGEKPEEEQCTEECHGECQENIEPDPELEHRRRINELREQMNEAARREDFEEAARIRDEIKAMES
ncbi:MAG: UvrB/UvrC motif-containing protein [Oscillospiraceae bacterium]|nr:UvrB/UvrC motif-containing protein [Oscillospiraceae bacterium]